VETTLLLPLYSLLGMFAKTMIWARCQWRL